MIEWVTIPKRTLPDGTVQESYQRSETKFTYVLGDEIQPVSLIVRIKSYAICFLLDSDGDPKNRILLKKIETPPIWKPEFKEVLAEIEIYDILDKFDQVGISIADENEVSYEPPTSLQTNMQI